MVKGLLFALALTTPFGLMQAHAGERTAALPDAPLPGAFARETGNTTIPIGWVGFCQRHPSHCGAEATAATDIDLTPAAWRTLASVNKRVNRAITPVTDQDHWGTAESWDFPTDGKGDCEDYVLEKRRQLVAAGFPRQALLITVVRDQAGEGHAVLTVKTNRGEYILDNKRQAIVTWSETGYSFIKRQSQTNQNAWVSLGGPNSSTATAASR